MAEQHDDQDKRTIIFGIVGYISDSICNRVLIRE